MKDISKRIEVTWKDPCCARRTPNGSVMHALSPLCCCAALRTATSLRAPRRRTHPGTYHEPGMPARSSAGRAQGCWPEAAAAEGRKCVLCGLLSSHSCFSRLSCFSWLPFSFLLSEWLPGQEIAAPEGRSALVEGTMMGNFLRAGMPEDLLSCRLQMSPGRSATAMPGTGAVIAGSLHGPAPLSLPGRRK